MSKLLSANIFLPDKITCIHCRSPIEKRALECEICGFTMEHLQGAFKTTPPTMLPFLNLGEELKKSETRSITKEIKKFEKRFMQHYLSVNIMPLPERVNLPEFAFWLHNSSPSGEDRPLAETSMLLINTSNSKTALSLGYQLETFIRSVDTTPLLKSLAFSVRKNCIAEGIVLFVREYRKVVEKSWKRSRQTLKESRSRH